MLNSYEVNAESLTCRKDRFHKSEEIECVLGRFLESRRLSLHHDHDHYINHGPFFESSNEISTIPESGIESREVSVINYSELHMYPGTSWMAAVLIMANCTIGMSLLNFPYAILNSGGILLSMLTQMVILIFIVISLTMMSLASQYYGDVSFQGVIGSHVGRIPKEICRIIIFINNFGALAVNLVVIGDQFEHIEGAVWERSGPYHWILNRKVMVPIISIVCILPLCFLKSFAIFKYSSFLGVLTALYISFGLIVTRYATLGSSKYKPPRALHTEHLTKMIPLICFAFECHIEIPPMVACLRRHSIWYYEKMILGYVILSSIVYSTAGICGYLTFGDDTPDNILLAYQLHDPLVIIAMVLLSLKIVTTYPVVFYCLKIVIEDYFKTLFIRYEDVKNFESILKAVITLLLFSGTVLVAIYIPNISSVINLIGGISAIFIFIFPGLCYLKLYSSKYRKWNWSMIILGAMYIVLGVFVMTMSTTQAIEEYLNY